MSIQEFSRNPIRTGILRSSVGYLYGTCARRLFYACRNTMRKADDYHEIGCKRCGKGGNWTIFTNGEGRFQARHPCGNVSKFEIQDKPDAQGISLRFFL